MNSLSTSFCDVVHFASLYEARLLHAKTTQGYMGDGHWRVLFGNVRIDPEVDLVVARMRLELACATHRVERKKTLA